MRLPRPPWIVAHRGALPLLENTLPALLLAVAEGADLLEFDVQATADGALVLHHDEHLGRLGGRPDLEVESASLAELASVALRHPQHPECPEPAGRIPTLAELFAALPPGFPVNIELKVRRSARGRLAELALAATAGRENVLFSSFDVALLRELRRRSAVARIAPLARRWTPGLERLGEELTAWSLHVAGGVARANAMSKGVSDLEGPEGLEGAAGARRREPGARASGRPPLLVYTVNDAAQARKLLAEGAAGLFTDRPAPLRAELGLPGESGVLSVSYRGKRSPRSSV